MNRKTFRQRSGFWLVAGAFMLILKLSCAQADPLKLLSLDFTSLPGDNLQVQIGLSGPAFSPRVFHTDNPARIALDLPGVSSSLDKKQIPVGVAGAESIQAISAADRTRVVINLTALLPYNTRVEGNNIYLLLHKGNLAPEAQPPTPAPPRASMRAETYGGAPGIRNIDFRRGAKGEGRILISLSNPKMVADIHEEGRKVIANFPNAFLAPSLARRLDVMDFATPVQSIDTMQEGDSARLVISPINENYDYSSYQSENQLTIEFRPLTKAEKDEIKKKEFTYSGERLSLNFQDIPVRSVLQILGDFTSKNIVASDTVQGNVTLRLNDVPWDQALDLVLKAKNLGKREDGNIIQVLPLEELNKQSKEQLEADKSVEDLEPLKTEIIQINYTVAEELKKVLIGTTEKTNQASQQQGIGGTTTQTNTTTLDVSQSILSPRGNVTVDQRTNQLIVKDTSRNLERVRELVRKLDVPVRQVLIESRVVIANNDFSRELGARFAVNQNPRQQQLPDANSTTPGATTTTFTRTIANNGFIATGDALSNLPINPTIAGPGGAVGFTMLKIGDYLLDLELAAAQQEGRGELVSNPRLITSDQTKAKIMQGVQIPYQATVNIGGSGVVTISYKDAVLELDVTPHITPDDNILMELMVKKDTPSTIQTPVGLGIDKREIDTNVQVGNGDTVVLGGVFEGTKNNTVQKVPFFGDLPGIGFMFRHTSTVDQKRELLIFITPKILKQAMVQR